MTTATPPPVTQTLLPSLLASLPSAAVSSQPPIALLPLLSPILRQRVQILSSDSKEPWLQLLCYSSNAERLGEVAKSDRLEPHPSSGEVEVDWDDVRIQYRRIDLETLKAQVKVAEFDLLVGLVYCVGDTEGGGDGWRIGEVDVLDSTTDADAHSYKNTISEAEAAFRQQHSSTKASQGASTNISTATESGQDTNASSWHIVSPVPAAEEKDGGYDDDDDAYWAQYDNHSSAATPAPQKSPAPDSMRTNSSAHGATEEDAYYAQYAQVQPALDSEDPDEAAQNGTVESTLGKEELARSLRERTDSHPESNDATRAWGVDETLCGVQQQRNDPYTTNAFGSGQELVQPRPGSSTGSSGSETVARLEAAVSQHNQSEIGVKQHVATSIKSLYRLAKAAGFDRAEFSSMVSTELELLSIGDDDD